MDSPAPKESPFPLPQPTFPHNGWLVDAHGRIFARSLGAREVPDQAYILGMSADDPRTAVVSFYEGPPMLSASYSVEPYHRGRAYYYHRRIEVIFVPSWAQTPLPSAVEGTARFWQQPCPEDGFPRGARRYYHLFVPLPSPIPSPLPLHAEPRTIEGWTVDRDGFVSIEPMGPNEITPEIERRTGRDSVPLKVVRVSYWKDEDRWAAADPMPSLPNTVRAAGGQYPPGAEVSPPRTPTPDHSPPRTPETPPQTFEAGYSLRDVRDWRRNVGNILIGPIGRRGMNDLVRPIGSKGTTVRPTGRCTGASLPQALPGTPPMDRGTGTPLPLALGGARLIGRKTRSGCHTGRHSGRIELPGPNPAGNCPPVGVEIAEEALPAAEKQRPLVMKVKKGVRIQGPQNDNDQTSPSSKRVEGSTNHFPSGKGCPHRPGTQGPGCWKETEGMQQGNIAPNGPTTIPLASKVKGTPFVKAALSLTSAPTDFKEEVPLLGPNGPAPNHALLQKFLRNPKSALPRLVEQLPCRIVAVNSGSLPIPGFYQLNPSPYAQLDYSLSLNVPPNSSLSDQRVDLIPSQAHHPTYMNASPEYLERTVGPGSPLEASYLKGFQYLKRLDTLGAIAQSPFKDEMNVLEAYKMLRPALQRGHLKFEEWCSEVDRLEGKRCLSLALVHLATHMALDTIAYLGGLESPPQAPDPGTPDNSMRWNAVLMERLGMPCWGIMPRVVPQRLDFDAGGQLDADPLKEADFQRGMQRAPEEFSDAVKAVILQALDSEMPDAYTIEETSEKLKGLLGSKVWDIPLHLGAHNSVSESLIEVPLGYFHPELRFPLRTGHAPKVMASAISPNKPSTLQVRDLAEQYRPQGILAFKGSLVLVKERGIRQKDSQKVLEINFLFKRPDQRDAVLQSLRESNPKVDARAVDTDPQNWRSDYQHFFDEGYIRQLFADPRPIKDIEALLKLAPPSSRPVNTREAAKTVAVDMERARQALLLQMFEAERYPPLVRPPHLPPKIPRSLGQFWCTSQFLHELTQAPCPENLSEGDHLCLKRLSLFLLLLAEFSRAAFRIPLYASQLGPYVCLIRHIVLCIQRAFEAESVLCGKAPEAVEPGRSFNQGARDESVGAECVQYAPKDRRFLIVLDPNRESPEYTPSKAALEVDAKQVEAVIARVLLPELSPFALPLQLLMQDLQTAVCSRPSSTPFRFSDGKKTPPCQAFGHASDSTVRPASDSTVRPASNSTATRRSNRSKLKEVALPVDPTTAGAKPLYKKKPQKKGLGDERGGAALGAKSRVKTYQKRAAQPQDIHKEPEKVADPPQAPRKSQTGRTANTDPARFDGVVLESPARPSLPTLLGDIPSSSIPDMPRIPKGDSEAAEVAEGLEGLGDEGEDFSRFPADQFKEPLDSEEEQRRLLAPPTGSETEAFNPDVRHKAYSEDPGKASKDTEVPSSSESNGVVLSFEDSTTDGEYISGLEEAMNNERNPRDLARLEAERAARLEAWQARAKGKEAEAEADNEAEEEELEKPQAEEERERYAALAQEMQVPAELVLQTAHAQTGKLRGGLGMILPGCTLQRILTMVSLLKRRSFGPILNTDGFKGLAAVELSEIYRIEKAKASKEGKEGYKTWAKNGPAWHSGTHDKDAC
ncbi:hypothetical protein BS47DRAFT_1393706 [Hydnum rufescens UP504]|uniref:Uncharacterized protein n=1 Tax=Hydnum rufescens UP504 TaxID=1448309 RepID=A0A9P6DT89_9AGAM|nr:hypothetical protein BS47DRAFT_1393706 [Hydnum rufescens UP504]